MSRIGNAPITVPEGVEINISAENQVRVKGKLGELTQDVNPLIKIAMEDNTITLSRPNDEKETRWSMNCRFKSVFSPYGDKKIGEFFGPITLRAASELGVKYNLPKIK